MPASELGPWEPLGLESVVETFASAPFRWWVSGGCALDLHLGRTWRDHEDTDVGVVRSDLGALHTLLSQWDLHVAAAGQLTPWHGAPLEVARHQNNVWCRLTADGPWVLDVTIGEGSDEMLDLSPRPVGPVALGYGRAANRRGHPLPGAGAAVALQEQGPALRRTTSMRPRSSQASMLDSVDCCRRLLESNHPWQRRLA